MRPLARALARGAGLLLVACSVGEGKGEAVADPLRAPGCFEGRYDLKPNFFAANPYRNTQIIRLQRTDDLAENSDGVQILVNDTEKIRARLGQPLKLALPVGVRPPGTPIIAETDPALVHLSLYLNETCHGQNITLYAVKGTITFDHLFSGDRNEETADDRLTEARFEGVELADPRDQPPGGGEIPPEKRSLLRGNFRFYFERGQPAQPFP